MQALLRKIRQILKDRRTRRFFTRFVASVAAIVVFVTTYALILPAITLEKTAACGIEEHQHSDSCYEKRLICGQEESDGHHHDDSCYTVTSELTCGIQEHQHSEEDGCYDADGNLVCELQEHVHDDSCYKEVSTLTCGLEESKGHHHTDACYEKVLVCGKEVHTHGEQCYQEDGSTDSGTGDISDGMPSDQADAGDTVPGISDPDAAAEEAQHDSYVPELDSLNMAAVLNSHTDFYYFHAEEGQEVPAESGKITDWQKVEEKTALISTDLVKMYLAYTIPAGSLNETNPTVRYRMPANLHLSDEQIDAMNRYENGIAAGYKDFGTGSEENQTGELYQKYLGAEAVEGERRPDEQLKDGVQEYISAVVRAENVYDEEGIYGEKGAYLGQDLIFTFVPYSIEKNRNTYDTAKTIVSAGEELTGWFACDFRLDQIDWEQEENHHDEDLASEDQASEDQQAEEGQAKEGQVEKDQAEEGKAEEGKTEADKTEEDKTADENTGEDNDKKDIENTAHEDSAAKTARVVFVSENRELEIEEISRVLRMTGENADGESAETQNEQIFDAGTLTAEGDGYKITLEYTEEAKIPKGASLSVREITAETDQEAYEACLAQAGQEVAADDQTSVDREASRFFDIEIIVTETDSDGTEKTVKIEPTAPVSVNIQISEKPAAQEDKSDQNEPAILHFAEEGVEQIDSTVTESQDNSIGEEQNTEIQFEADSFSVYGVVYTVDFHYEVNGKVYEFSLPGGGFVSLEALMEVLHIADPNEPGVSADENAKSPEESSDTGASEEETPGAGVSEEETPDTETTEGEAPDAETSEGKAPDAEASDAEEQAIEKRTTDEQVNTALTLNDVQISEATKKLVKDIEGVEFSKPEFVWVGKVDTETTVGTLKEKNSLVCQPSAELTEEQLTEINAQTVKAGDWALISLQPFLSTETLTVTMKNGDQFVVRVTDAQNPSVFLGKEVIIYDNTEKQAMTSNYATDYRTHFNTVSEPVADNDPTARWKIEQANGGYYLRSNEGKYLYIDHTNVRLVDNSWDATVLTIQAGSNPDYRIYAANTNNNQNALRYCENEQYPGFFSAVDGTNGAGTSREWLYIREAKPIYDRVGDWLLYFDDDFSGSEITVHVGETITLRPYNKWEWKEGNVDVQTAHWNVGTWNDWSISSSDENGAKIDTTSDGPFDFTRYVKYDDQLVTHYWSVQGRATKTGDYTLTNTKNNKTITVHVVDGPPVNQPKTINKIANIKVNLFDYDKNGVLDGSWNNETQWWNDDNLANQSGNYKNDSVNKMGGSDHFYFLSSGSGDNSSEPWNSYSHADSNPDIVQNELDSEGYPVLNHGSNTSLKYLFDTSKKSWNGGNNNDGMIAYPDVVGMFQKDPQTGYYYYNSNTNYFYYDTDTGKSKLYEHTYTQTSSEAKGSLVNDKPIGFFPFHDYDATDNLSVNQNHNLNHHVGMSMEIEFMLPNNRLDDNGQPIVFDFSGDDDLWVFVEWTDDNGEKHSKRMLDLGGIHQPITGQINFTDDESIEAHKPYTLKVFYLERGGCDSNCSIRFNLPIIQDLTVAKKLTGLTEAEKAKYKDEEFTYEIVVNGQPYSGPNGPEKIVIRNAAGENITPANFRITNGRVTIKDGETITISYLDRSDTFSVAEVKTTNMENFETPNAERYYHLEHDASLYEEEIHLTESVTQVQPPTADWVTPTYELEDTEKVTITNTLKEKNLEVEKKWKGEKDHPDSIKFIVTATVEDEDGIRQPYAVAALKESDGTTDKQFTLSNSNKWRYEIEHLPVNTPDGKFIFYDISEGQVEGYTLTGLKDITAEEYNYCNVDVVKLWPDSNEEHTEVIEVVLKNSEEKYYAGVDNKGEALFVDNISDAVTYNLTKDNNYTHRFERVPAGTYTAEQLHEDIYSKGLATYVRNIIQYELENSPVEEQVDPGDQSNTPEIHKRIDALRDGVTNPDSPHAGEDKTDLYRLYLDYKIKSLQEADGVDLLFVIDHSGSMNNSAWQGNPYRAPAVEDALNGDDGLISEFLDMNQKNQWAAVGFKGPDGAENYYWSLLNPWRPATALSAYNAGQNGSEVLSPGGEDYVFTRTDASPQKNVTLANEGPDILTNYTAGFWRAEQFLLNQSVKGDGRKKVIVLISDGIPTLHIDCADGTLQGAGTADGSWYYRDAYGGCPDETLTEFGYFVNDMTRNGYSFGENMEFYTIGFGGTMQTESGSDLLNGMLDLAYGEDGHTGHFMTISDTDYDPWDPYATVDYSTASNHLKDDLRTIMGMNETFSNIVIQDDLSTYVDLYGLAAAGTNTADIMRAAKAKVTMKVPDPDNPDEAQIITLYENGAPVNSDDAKFTRADGTTKANIIQKLEYDASSKTVKIVFDPEYQAAAGTVYTVSFDVKATDQAYNKYAASGYDKYTEGDKQGQVITGDPDTDFFGTDPDNATSVDKAGFRSNDEAKATYKHNDKEEELEYPHPVIQVAAKADIIKIDETGAALESAKFNLYSDSYDPDKSIEENAGCLIEADLQSKKPVDPAGNEAVIRSGKLSEGTYYLVETKAPDGYNSIPGPVKITVRTTDGVLNMTAEIAGETVGNDKLQRIGRGVWKLSIQNTAGYELPHTGGPGTGMIYLLGISLIILAGAGYVMKRRRIYAA